MNLNLPTSVVCLGPIQSCAYYYYDDKLNVKRFTNTFVHSYNINVNTGNIIGLTFAGNYTGTVDYDGALFFTFEDKGDIVAFRRWELDFNQHSLVLRKTATYPKHSYYYFDYCGFTVENFARSITSPLAYGSNRVYISNTSFIEVGQLCVVGPSTAGSSNGKVESIKVIHVDANFVILERAVNNDYKYGDPVTFIGNLILASKFGIGGSYIPMLYYLDIDTLHVVGYNSVYQLSSVVGASFADNNLYLTSKYNTYIYRVDQDKIANSIYLYQKCNGYLDVFNIVASNGGEFYTVQKMKATFSNFSCSVSSFSRYGFVSNMTMSYANTVSVVLEELTDSDTVNGSVYVFDQYGRGLYGQRVTVVSDDTESEIHSSNWYTDVYGKIYFTYKYGDNSDQKITAYVSSTYPDRSSDYVFGIYHFYLSLVPEITTNTIKLLDEYRSQLYQYICEFELEYEEELSNMEKGIGCTSEIHDFKSDIKSDYKVGVYATVLDYLSDVICDSNINGRGIGEVATYITAYTNGPVTVNTQINTFIFISYFKPIPFSTKNPRNAFIDVYIFPSGYTLNVSTFNFSIREVNVGLEYDSGWIDITQLGNIDLIDIGGRYAIRFTYLNESRYKYSSVVNCRLFIYDNAAIPNRYYFECWFSIVEDIDKPVTISESPECGDVDVPVDADICVVVNDDGVGIDTDNIRLYVDGIPVYYTVYSLDNNVVMVYKNVAKFFPGSIVTYSWTIQDELGNIMHEACQFSVEQSKSPLIIVEDICDDIVDNRFSFSFDVYDTGSGVKYDSVELILHNKLAPFISRPILYRIK